MQNIDFRSLQDEELFLLVKENNEFAFDELFRRHWNALFRSALSILDNTEMARDTTQEIFTQLWLKRHRLSVKNPPAYLYQMTKHKCFELQRRNKLAQRVLNTFNHLNAANDTEEKVNFHEAQALFEKGLTGMPGKAREVFRLSRVENLSNQEVAARLNISVKTVEYHITNACKHLRLSMTDLLAIIIFTIF